MPQFVLELFAISKIFYNKNEWLKIFVIDKQTFEKMTKFNIFDIYMYNHIQILSGRFEYALVY